MQPNESDKKDLNSLLNKAKDEFAECSTEMENIRKGDGYSWDEREEQFLGNYYRSDKDGNRERYMDSTGDLTTLAIDRACRVMGQIPTGRFQNLSGDTGKNLLMNLIFEHYVIPFSRVIGTPILSSLRTADLYSDLFSIPMFVEWCRSKAYSGPKFVVIHPRRFYPQAGKESIGEMDYCFIDTFPSKEWLKGRNGEVYMNIQEIIDRAANSGPESTELSPSERNKKHIGIRLRHRFGSDGSWLIWNPDTDLPVFYEKKWFPRIPIALKHQYPKLGSLWSYTNFERGHAQQFTIDSLSQSTIRAAEMMIDPPSIMDPVDVILSSFKRKPGQKIFVKRGKTEAIKFMEVNPQALPAFSNMYQILRANMLSMSASTDTSVPAKVDPGFGKTPDAIKQQAARLGSRDSWDQDSMQMFIEDAFSIAADEIASMGIDSYSFDLMKEAVENLQEDYPKETFKEFITENKATIATKRVEGKYRYVMEPGSTLIGANDTAETILEMMKLHAENPNIANDLAARNQRFDFGAAYRMILREKGSRFANKLIVSANENPEGTDGVGESGATVEPNVTTEQSLQ